MTDIIVPVYQDKIPNTFNEFLFKVFKNTRDFNLICAVSSGTQPKNVNTGLTRANSPFIAILDWDVYVPPRWLKILTQNLKDDESIGIIGAKLIGNYYGLNRQAPLGVSDWPTLAGGLMVFRNIGLKWDETFPSGYWADTDFCRQYKKKGYKVAINGDIEAEHDIYTTETTDNTKLTKEGEKIYKKKWGDNGF